MFFLKKPTPSPRGVPLEDLCVALRAIHLTASRKGDTLIVRHQNLATRIDVLSLVNGKKEDMPRSAAVTISTRLPEEFAPMLCKPGRLSSMNAMASLGALTEDNGRYFVGSRLSINREHDAWEALIPLKAQVQLILCTTLSSTHAILQATGKVLANQPPAAGESDWSCYELERVAHTLSVIHACSADRFSLTAKLKLGVGTAGAAAGDSTALWQIMANQPHPELGGGLLCLLQMPHRAKDEQSLDRALCALNRMEMAPQDLPPHFGAWCRGNFGNNPAYATFLPNALRVVDGIAIIVSFWAMQRAEWADAVLATMGIPK